MYNCRNLQEIFIMLCFNAFFYISPSFVSKEQKKTKFKIERKIENF
jgi:hypothetical protein